MPGLVGWSIEGKLVNSGIFLSLERQTKNIKMNLLFDYITNQISVIEDYKNVGL